MVRIEAIMFDETIAESDIFETDSYKEAQDNLIKAHPYLEKDKDILKCYLCESNPGAKNYVVKIKTKYRNFSMTKEEAIQTIIAKLKRDLEKVKTIEDFEELFDIKVSNENNDDEE